MVENKDKLEKTYLSQAIWAVSGIVLGAASVLSFCTPGAHLLQIVPWLGGAMLFAGSANVFLYFKRYKKTPGGRWMLADGMTAALLSVFLLFNQMAPVAVIPFFFCVWELFSGILRLMESGVQKEQNIQGWQWFFTVGMIEIIAGIAALLKPVEETLTTHVVIGIVLLIQSIAFIHKAFALPRTLAYKKR